MRHDESNIQRNCVEWFNLQYPQWRGLLFAVPNGGARDKVEAAAQLDRRAYGFEVNKEFYKGAQEKVLKNIQKCIFI